MASLFSGSLTFTALAAALVLSAPRAASQELLEPGSWSPGGVSLTLRMRVWRPSVEYAEIDVLDFWMQRVPPDRSQVVWFARRERNDDTTVPIEIISSQTCPDVFEAIAAFKALDPPRPDLMLQGPPSNTIPPGRLDGADFRITYRAENNDGHVQLRNLSRRHYDWASDTRVRLRDCWASGWRIDRAEAGTMAPGSRPEW